MEIVGTRGAKGKKAKNSRTKFSEHFDFGNSETVQGSDDSVKLNEDCLSQLEKEQP
jgi:hypothetical protein